ncbi:MAG TPA: LEA type 2 family protein [Myxococcota bacterium]|nr:LEA type 2 family protein [Myxococcota bacterium]
MNRAWWLALTLTSGCAKVGSLEDLGLDRFMPTVEFRKLKVTDLDFQRIDTNFVFAVENPNPIKVTLSSFSYDLDLDGKNLIDGNQKDGLSLEAQGESKLVFPVGVVFADLFQLVGDLHGKDDVPFTFNGKIGFNTPLGEIKLPFREAGQFPVVHLPRVGFKAVRVGNLDILHQKATINVDLGLAHDGGSPLTFDGFDYHLKLGGRKVAEGVLEHLANVSSGSEEVVSLPVQLNLLEIGATIVDAITKKTKLDVGLEASVAVGTPFGAIPLTINERGDVDVR